MLRRLWSRVARVLAARRSRDYVRREVHGIELLLLGRRRMAVAEQVFNRISRALYEITVAAPDAYAAMRRDVVRIVFPERDQGHLYHPFQMTLVVPPAVALEDDARRYAAWLVAALEAGGHGARARYGEQLLAAWPEAEREAIRAWLVAMRERTRGARVREAAGSWWSWEEGGGLRSGGGGGGGRTW